MKFDPAAFWFLPDAPYEFGDEPLRLCHTCWRPTPGGDCAYCMGCLSRQRGYLSEWREKHRDAGLCPRCGQTPIEVGAWCSECRARQAQYSRKHAMKNSPVPSPTYHCHRCHEDKPAEAFYRDSRRNTGLASRCKACDVLALRERYAANPERQKAQSAKWRAEHREQKREADRLRYQKRKQSS